MAHVTFRGVTDDVRDLVGEFIKALEMAGHHGTIVINEADAPAVDPFVGMDIDAIPDQILTNMGISREELRRGREMKPAVDVNAHHAAQPGPGGTPPVPAPAGGLPTP